MFHTSDTRPAIHIGFLDNNAIHAISPLLDSRIPLSQAVFFYEPNMLGRTEDLTSVAEQHKIEIRFIAINEFSVAKRQQHIHQQLAQLIQDDSRQYFINLSCGNRWQVLAALPFAIEHNIACYMIDAQTDELAWVTPSDNSTLNVSDTICLRNFFRAYGSDIKVQMSDALITSPATLDILNKWLKNAHKLQHGFGVLNKITMATDSSGVSQTLTKYIKSEPSFATLLADIERLEWGQLDEHDHLHFKHADVKKLVAGGWLEYVSYQLIQEISYDITTIQDAGWGIQISRNQDTLENELDVALLANNKLHIIECKTKTFPSGEVKSIVYQLDALADILGGFTARGALVTLKPVSHNDWLRASELGVKIFGPEQLPDLKRQLANWIRRA